MTEDQIMLVILAAVAVLATLLYAWEYKRHNDTIARMREQQLRIDKLDRKNKELVHELMTWDKNIDG